VSVQLRGFSDFPYLHQVCRIERVCYPLHGGEPSSEVRYAATSLSAQQADPARLLQLARGHWSIENKVHYVRDRTFDEDRSQVRKHNAPQTMATLRNLAISLFRLAGVNGETSIAAALRHCAHKVRSTLRLIGLH
jgi:hypothetical protein